MTKFDSPIGSRSFRSQQLREFTVPDESEHNHAELPSTFDVPEPQDLEEQIRNARNVKIQGERLNVGAKKRIEMLLGMTRSTRDVDIEGNIFTLQSLKAKEIRESIMITAQFDGTVEGPFEIRRQYLARSLTHIAGVDINSFLGTSSFETKLAFIDELDEGLISHLYSEYLELAKTARDKFSLKTEEDIEGVIEDLKK